MKKKILLHRKNENQIGGPNRSVENMKNSFLSEKYEMCYLTQDIELNRKGFFLLAIISLVQKIKKEKPDLVQVMGLQVNGFLCTIAAKLCGCKVLITARGFTEDAIGFNKIKKMIVVKILEPIQLILADHVITVCEHGYRKKTIQKYARKKTTVIHNAAPTILIKKEKFELRKKFNILKNEIICITVGRITYDKGFFYLAEAILKLKINKEIKFIIVGEGDYFYEFSEMLKEQIEDKQVIMLGKRKDVLDILEETDIFIFPTLHENLSNALLEACSTNNAIIATNVGGNKEVIKNNINGILIESRDSMALAKNIERISKDKKLRQRLAKNALKTSCENFSKEKLYGEYNEVYKEIFSK